MYVILSLIVLALDIFAILDVMKSSMDNANRTFWIVMIFLLPVVGMVLYFLIGRKEQLARALSIMKRNAKNMKG